MTGRFNATSGNNRLQILVADYRFNKRSPALCIGLQNIQCIKTNKCNKWLRYIIFSTLQQRTFTQWHAVQLLWRHTLGLLSICQSHASAGNSIWKFMIDHTRMLHACTLIQWMRNRFPVSPAGTHTHSHISLRCGCIHSQMHKSSFGLFEQCKMATNTQPIFQPDYCKLS